MDTNILIYALNDFKVTCSKKLLLKSFKLSKTIDIVTIDAILY